MMIEPLALGVIGLGRAGMMHLQNLLNEPSVKVVAVADANLAQLALPEQLQAKVYDDASDLLANPQVKAVCIFAPTNAHEGLVRAAANAGKHIFCEKPLSMATDEAVSVELLRTVKRAGVQLQIGFNRRFDPQFQMVHDQTAKAAPAERQVVKITSRDPDLLPHALIQKIGGLVFDFTMHDFDMARYLMGKNVIQVFATGSTLIDPTLREIDDVDTLATVLTFEDGSLAVIDNSRRAVYGYDQRVEVFGSFGMVKAENTSGYTVEAYTDTAIELPKPYPHFSSRYQSAYQAELRAFAHAIQVEEQVPVSGIDALMAQRVAIAAMTSLHTHLPVAVDPQVPVL